MDGRHWRLGSLSALSAIAMVTTGCSLGSIGNASPSRSFSDGSFRWTLTRLEGATPDTQIGWLDNETVLFIGSNKSYNRSQEIRGLYAWNRKSPARLILANAGRYCFDGKTWTAITAEKQKGSPEPIYRRYRVNPGDLSTTWIGPDEVGPIKGYQNQYTCRDEKRPDQLAGRYWNALRPQDGFLDFGADGTQNQEAHLLSADLKNKTPIAINTKNPSSQTIKYSRYSGAYIIYDYLFSLNTLASWNKEKTFVVHQLKPDGKARKIMVNAGPWSKEVGGDRSINPTRAGFAISSKAGQTTTSAENGLFLVKTKRRFIKLDGGVIRSAETSPDGCKLTYTQTTSALQTHLKTANFCAQPPTPDEANQHSAP